MGEEIKKDIETGAKEESRKIDREAPKQGQAPGGTDDGHSGSETHSKAGTGAVVHVILKAVALAMGVTVFMLTVLRDFNVEIAIGMLGLGLACLAAASLARKDD